MVSIHMHKPNATIRERKEFIIKFFHIAFVLPTFLLIQTIPTYKKPVPQEKETGYNLI